MTFCSLVRCSLVLIPMESDKLPCEGEGEVGDGKFLTHNWGDYLNISVRQKRHQEVIREFEKEKESETESLNEKKKSMEDVPLTVEEEEKSIPLVIEWLKMGTLDGKTQAAAAIEALAGYSGCSGTLNGSDVNRVRIANEGGIAPLVHY